MLEGVGFIGYNIMKEEKIEEKKDEVSSSQEATGAAEKSAEVPAKFETLVEQIEQMSVLEMAELVKVLEKKFGVSATAPIAAVAVGAAGGEGAGAAEEKSVFNVELTESGANKINVIKALRTVTDKGLKEAKDMVDGAPKMVKEGVSKEEAENIKKQLEAAGAKVTLK